MTRLIQFGIFCFACLALFAKPAGSQEIPAKDRCVIVISIDGLPAKAWSDPQVPMPYLQRLAREGTLAKGMTVSNPSITWPNHTTLVTGVTPA